MNPRIDYPDKNPDLMNVEDVARRLKVSPSFIYQAVAEGRLKHFRLGKGQGGLRVSEEQLEVFLEAQERGGPSVAEVPSVKKVTTNLKHLA